MMELAAQPLRTENVILITADGLRHQEVFSGVDRLLLDHPDEAGIQRPGLLKETFWRDSARERREVLLPTFWRRLAPGGVVLGNREAGSEVVVTNPHRVSSPGYSEILTGRPLAEVQNNNPVRIPRETALEFARRKLSLPRTGVAAFASWEIFRYLVAHREDAFIYNAGYERLPADINLPAVRQLDELQFKMLTPWSSVRHDAVTAGLALEYLRTYRPRVLYVALGETDDWAHNRRYDRVIDAIQIFDDFLLQLWNALQAMENYRDQTTLIITSDHGRGSGLDDWTRHGRDVEGAEYIWLAVIGPDTPDRGEVSPAPRAYQKSVAGTLLKFLGLDPQEFSPSAGEPLDLAF